ncbi:hypothetical protein [Desulfocurvibacter africanus]|uniref:hypothetical protein n=1 Tax=Desulfocurvibacter africanus TaxID=873 RepID=UPI0003F8A2DA|nr:hypothetical protein [Desulfocurvibacter africanus]
MAKNRVDCPAFQGCEMPDCDRCPYEQGLVFVVLAQIREATGAMDADLADLPEVVRGFVEGGVAEAKAHGKALAEIGAEKMRSGAMADALEQIKADCSRPECVQLATLALESEPMKLFNEWSAMRRGIKKLLDNLEPKRPGQAYEEWPELDELARLVGREV